MAEAEAEGVSVFISALPVILTHAVDYVCHHKPPSNMLLLFICIRQGESDWDHDWDGRLRLRLGAAESFHL